MKWLGVWSSLLWMSVMIPVAYGWDCSDPTIDCHTLLVTKRGATRSGESNRTIVVRVPEEVAPEEYLTALAKSRGVAAIEPAFKTRLALSESAPLPPNDLLFGEQNHLNGAAGLSLDVSGAWSLVTQASVTVAVIDSGVDYTHPDLAGNIWTNIGEIPGNGQDDDANGYADDVHGYNFYADTANPIDDHSHGTHMAGIIGAVGNNKIGVTGLLWRVEIMPLRFTDPEGIGDTIKAIEAIHYAVANGARVINMSWTIMGEGNTSQALRQTISSYQKAGVVFVTAAGNGDTSFIGFDIDEFPVYPASFQLGNLITVGASDPLGNIASFSNYGAGSVHLLAPGANILSTLPGNSYGEMSGTSASTAVVSAAAAMVLTESPGLTSEEVKNLLLSTVNDDPGLVGRVQTAGTLNLRAPLDFLATGQTITPPVFPEIDDQTNESDDSDKSFTSFSESGGCQLNPKGPSQASLAFLLIGVIIVGLAIIRLS